MRQRRSPPPREELWWRLGHAGSLAHERWPEWGRSPLLADAQVEIPAQVMGRVLRHLVVTADADAPALERAAPADAEGAGPDVAARPFGAIVVPGKLVNIVTG